MASAFDADGTEYRVLANQQGQHSIWPAGRAAPPGWTGIGPVGGRRQCLDWIETNWKDIRPQPAADESAAP